ncbi:transposase [Hymenobacter sp. DH14]|uniref:Transposase n=1 Tax=Hymenobacter cyanobacteriorum TaxID=2926463 RepID=A0A9X2AIQ5_9BACT|nr:transposase [Hymenobacter cyanobacteriorum]
MLDALGNCLHLVLTPGHWADCTQLPALLAGLRHAPGAVVADKAYGTNAVAVLAAIAGRHAEPVMLPKTSRNGPRAYDQNLYANRNKAERFFGRLKEARSLATRYDKTAASPRLCAPTRRPRLA